MVFTPNLLLLATVLFVGVGSAKFLPPVETMQIGNYQSVTGKENVANEK
jgi:hypothetical protein